MAAKKPTPTKAAKTTKAPSKKAAPKKKSRYVIVRGQSSGVFAGYFGSRSGREVVLTNFRRIWKWEGAASVSELASRGTSKPAHCMFPAAAPRIEILDAIEVLDCTAAAQASIEGVPTWTK